MRLVPENIERLVPYVPGKPVEELERELNIVNAVKLASNENPRGPSPHALEAMREHAGNVHRYPDAAVYELRLALAAHHGLVFMGFDVEREANNVLTEPVDISEYEEEPQLHEEDHRPPPEPPKPKKRKTARRRNKSSYL